MTSRPHQDPSLFALFPRRSQFDAFAGRKILIRMESRRNRCELTLTAMMAPLGRWRILTTCPLVPLPNSLRYSKSFTFVSNSCPLIFKAPVLSARSRFSVSIFLLGCSDGIGSAGVGLRLLFGVKFKFNDTEMEEK